MNSLIRKILIGKLYRFFPKHNLFVIVGVRKSLHSDGGLEILVAKFYEKTNEAIVYSWYSYHEALYFENRSPKEVIKKCLKTNPDKIKYHLGKQIDINKIKIYDNRYTKEYEKYLKSL